ncbi:MAG: SMP-30/gluconolactonase/LRE family protein [Polyangiaceae bacterium]|nr:SMP-30/gluconolactonase/LRE family protein [Polyangiaceae bacterium]
MKRILPFALVLVSGAWIYACSSSSSDDNSDNTPDDENQGEVDSGGGTTTTDAGHDADAAKTDASDSGDADQAAPPVEATNPIPDGTVATSALDGVTLGSIGGVVWTAGGGGSGSLYYTQPDRGDGIGDLVFAVLSADGKITSPAQPGAPDLTDECINGIDRAGGIALTGQTLFYTNPANQQLSSRSTNGDTLVDGSAACGAKQNGQLVAHVQSPIDLVLANDGTTIYVVDSTNGVYKVDIVTKDATSIGMDDADVANQPTGVALSKDGNTLYVSLAKTSQIIAYSIAADGTVTKNPEQPFPAFTANNAVNNNTHNGLAVDSGGNVYVATSSGVQVFKPSGDPWGTIPVANGANNISFGGPNKTTLYIGANLGIYTAPVAVAGQ